MKMVLVIAVAMKNKMSIKIIIKMHNSCSRTQHLLQRSLAAQSHQQSVNSQWLSLLRPSIFDLPQNRRPLTNC